MILETEKLCFAYGSMSVLNDVSIRIEPGVTAIIGSNAAGKSTLLKCVSGMLNGRGQIRFDGRDLRDFKLSELTRLISYLPQDFSTRAALTVFETVLLGKQHELGWRVGHEDIGQVEQLLDEMNLTVLADRYITELSGGQIQMVAIAQALVREPTVLLLDEPTSNLDLRHQFEICTLIAKLTASRRLSTIVALHDLNLAARYADYMIALKNGRIIGVGTPDEVMKEDILQAVFGIRAHITRDPLADTPMCVAYLADAKESKCAANGPAR